MGLRLIKFLSLPVFRHSGRSHRPSGRKLSFAFNSLFPILLLWSRSAMLHTPVFGSPKISFLRHTLLLSSPTTATLFSRGKHHCVKSSGDASNINDYPRPHDAHGGLWTRA